MPLSNGVQVIVQYPDGGSGGVCRAFAGLPDTTPAWFLIEAASPADASHAEHLGRQLVEVLLRSWPSATEEPAPCGGTVYGSCHAQTVPECAKVLLPVFGPATLSPTSIRLKVAPAAGSGAQNAKTIPVLACGVPASVLPATMCSLNALAWQPDDHTGVIDILRLGGLTTVRSWVWMSARSVMYA